MPTLFIESDLSSLMSYDSSSETVTIRKTFEINPIYTSTGGEIRFYAPIKMYKGTISNIPSSTLLIPLPTGITQSVITLPTGRLFKCRKVQKYFHSTFLVLSSHRISWGGGKHCFNGLVNTIMSSLTTQT